MRNHISCVLLAIMFALSASGASRLCASPPSSTPTPTPKKSPIEFDTRRMVDVPLKKKGAIDWHFEENFARGISTQSDDGKQVFNVVRAVDIGPLDQTQRNGFNPKSPFAVWTKKFDDPSLKSWNGYASVVDENVLTDCRRITCYRMDEMLDHDGFVVGRVKLKEYDPVELAEFLVGSGIIDANIHIKATITGTNYTSEAGEWFSLRSNDPYWTNRSNFAKYDFGIHLSTDGTIRVIHVKDIGRLLEQKEQPSADAALPK